MTAFATPGPVTATVEVAGAQVRVTASDRTDTVVLVEPRNAASRKDVKVACKTKVDLADGQLTIKTITPGDKTGSVVITIGLPTGSSLAAYLAHSSVQVDGSVSQCELHMASGRVQLDRIDALRANISTGDTHGVTALDNFVVGRVLDARAAPRRRPAVASATVAIGRGRRRADRLRRAERRRGPDRRASRCPAR